MVQYDRCARASCSILPIAKWRWQTRPWCWFGWSPAGLFWRLPETARGQPARSSLYRRENVRCGTIQQIGQVEDCLDALCRRGCLDRISDVCRLGGSSNTDQAWEDDNPGFFQLGKPQALSQSLLDVCNIGSFTMVFLNGVGENNHIVSHSVCHLDHFFIFNNLINSIRLTVWQGLVPINTVNQKFISCQICAALVSVAVKLFASEIAWTGWGRVCVVGPALPAVWLLRADHSQKLPDREELSLVHCICYYATSLA